MHVSIVQATAALFHAVLIGGLVGLMIGRWLDFQSMRESENEHFRDMEPEFIGSANHELIARQAVERVEETDCRRMTWAEYFARALKKHSDKFAETLARMYYE